MGNYFNSLSENQKKEQLSKCRFMDSLEFRDGIKHLKGKEIAIIGCGAQGLNQGLNTVSYTHLTLPTILLV